MLIRRMASATILAATALTLLPSLAQADTSVYHPNTNARTFGANNGGWGANSEASGACFLVLTCPTVVNSRPADGGTGGQGDGHLRTQLGLLLGVAGEVKAFHRSPNFVYTGVNGKQPDEVRFNLDRRADVDAFLSVLDNEADYTVSLINVSKGNAATTLVAPSTLEGAAAWTGIPTVQVDPAQLIRGDTYRFEITSRFAFTADVIPGSSADYDNVVLTAETEEPGDPGKNVTCEGLIPGTGKNDKIRGTKGADRIKGFKGNDTINGIRGDDCLFGNNDDDTIKGAGGADDIHGNAGNDSIRGGKGRDTLAAGSGDDLVKGGTGNDTIKGNSGEDMLRGGKDRDTIKGGGGKDSIRGGGGRDRINVRGLGKDKVNCGGGRDRVVADARDKVAKNCERVKIR